MHAEECEANMSRPRGGRRNNNFVFYLSKNIGLPDVVTMWRLGVERVLKEVGAKLICVTCTSLNLSCSLSSSSFFFELDQKSSLQGGVKRIHDL